MKKVLFQGDSITDAGRDYTVDYHLGYGYATLVAAELGMEKGNEYCFYNRGISGNRSIDLLARIKSDLINLKPDYLSILIGVNDVWHEIQYDNGINTEYFEKYYDFIISQVQKELPDTKIMILEPFVLKGTGTESTWESFRSEVEEKAEVAKKIADKYELVFVPLMKEFDEAAEKVSAEHWVKDGVHPTAAGHELIKRRWLKGFQQLTGEI